MQNKYNLVSKCCLVPGAVKQYQGHTYTCADVPNLSPSLIIIASLYLFLQSPPKALHYFHHKAEVTKGGLFSSLPPPGGLMDHGYNTLDILLYGVTMHLMGLYIDLDGQSQKMVTGILTIG